jgi:hypothetical protein
MVTKMTFDESLTRASVRFGALGLLLSAVCLAIGVALRSALPPSLTPGVIALRLLAAVFRGAGVGFGALFGVMLIAGLSNLALSTWDMRKASRNRR